MTKFNCPHILLLLTAIFNYVEAKDGCRELDFLPCVKNKTFTRHVIQTSRILAPGLETCQHQCFLEDKCISYNLGPIDRQTRSCELSDADHLSHTSHLITRTDSEYCAIKNPCSSNPCQIGKHCTPDFFWDTFKCTDGIWTPWNETFCFCRWRRCLNPSTQENAADCIGPDHEQTKCKEEEIQDCSKPLGMEDGSITDAQITASSFYGGCPTRYGRLNYGFRSWCAGQATHPQYLQVDLGSIKTITKVATQGRHNSNQRVTEYTLAYSNNDTSWQTYGELDCKMKFSGNADRSTVVTNKLDIPIRARYIRVFASQWLGWPSMRLELYGCTLP